MPLLHRNSAKETPAGTGDMRAVAKQREKYTHDVTLGSHQLVADEPAEQGGLDDLLPLAERQGFSFLLGGPFNSGILATGAVPGAKYNYHEAPPEIMERVRRIEAVCRRHGVPLAAAAIRFPASRSSQMRALRPR